MDIRELVSSANMSSRPGYYSGRGATLSDLNSDILNRIADLIEKHYGKPAHDSYVKMVWEMPSLSATAFLNNLYALERANWDLSKAEIANDGNSFEHEGEAWGMLAEVMSQMGGNKKYDATNFIRETFRRVS